MTAATRRGAVGAVVVAAGRGVRLGAERPKALLEVAGRPLVVHAVERVLAAGIDHLVVVHTPGEHAAFAAALRELPATLVEGGATRTASVRAGVAALPPAVDLVAVHDAARAFTPPAVVAATVAAVRDGADDVLGAAPGLPVADTLKRVVDGEVVATVDRDELVAIQTPQTFPRTVLAAALDLGDAATDDLGLVERLRDTGAVTGRLVLVAGSPDALKVTYPEDVAAAERLAAEGR
ncbi:NTP transferase domain-containing protein [Nitriliruptoraceae bacterium ZYF776]|nr:NTP transferase domain-containing protein [Profundirhabdus halotolerans]